MIKMNCNAFNQAEARVRAINYSPYYENITLTIYKIWVTI